MAALWFFRQGGSLFHTQSGTPQGGVISPCLMVMTLQGLEQRVKAVAKRSDKVHVVVYADDFNVTASSKEILKDKVLPAINQFSKERGLRLSREKTSITHIDYGFYFLSFNVRKYNGKLLIKPAKLNCLKFLSSLSAELKKLRAESAATVIRVLNSKIRGWANYHRHVVSIQICSTMAHQLFWMTWRWAKRRHPNKYASWVRREYFCTLGTNNWMFFGKNNGEQSAIYSFTPVSVSIQRHVKIKSDSNPYDPAHAAYYKNRRRHCSSLSPSVIENILD